LTLISLPAHANTHLSCSRPPFCLTNLQSQPSLPHNRGPRYRHWLCHPVACHNIGWRYTVSAVIRFGIRSSSTPSAVVRSSVHSSSTTSAVARSGVRAFHTFSAVGRFWVRSHHLHHYHYHHAVADHGVAIGFATRWPATTSAAATPPRWSRTAAYAHPPPPRQSCAPTYALSIPSRPSGIFGYVLTFPTIQPLPLHGYGPRCHYLSHPKYLGVDVR
jgi:hypothetical protein